MEVRLSLKECSFRAHEVLLRSLTYGSFIAKKGVYIPAFFKQKQQAIVWSYSLDNRGPEMFCC